MLTVRDQLVLRGIGGVTAGTGCGRAGAAVRGSRRVRRAFVRRTRAKLPPRNGETPGDPGRLRSVIPVALLSLGCSRLLAPTGLGRQAWRAEGAPLSFR